MGDDWTVYPTYTISMVNYHPPESYFKLYAYIAGPTKRYSSNQRISGIGSPTYQVFDGPSTGSPKVKLADFQNILAGGITMYFSDITDGGLQWDGALQSIDLVKTFQQLSMKCMSDLNNTYQQMISTQGRSGSCTLIMKMVVNGSPIPPSPTPDVNTNENEEGLLAVLEAQENDAVDDLYEKYEPALQEEAQINEGQAYEEGEEIYRRLDDTLSPRKLWFESLYSNDLGKAFDMLEKRYREPVDESTNRIIQREVEVDPINQKSKLQHNHKSDQGHTVPLQDTSIQQQNSNTAQSQFTNQDQISKKDAIRKRRVKIQTDDHMNNDNSFTLGHNTINGSTDEQTDAHINDDFDLEGALQKIAYGRDIPVERVRQDPEAYQYVHEMSILQNIRDNDPSLFYELRHFSDNTKLGLSTYSYDLFNRPSDFLQFANRVNPYLGLPTYDIKNNKRKYIAYDAGLLSPGQYTSQFTSDAQKLLQQLEHVGKLANKNLYEGMGKYAVKYAAHDILNNDYNFAIPDNISTNNFVGILRKYNNYTLNSDFPTANYFVPDYLSDKIQPFYIAPKSDISTPRAIVNDLLLRARATRQYLKMQELTRKNMRDAEFMKEIFYGDRYYDMMPYDGPEPMSWKDSILNFVWDNFNTLASFGLMAYGAGRLIKSLFGLARQGNYRGLVNLAGSQFAQQFILRGISRFASQHIVNAINDRVTYPMLRDTTQYELQDMVQRYPSFKKYIGDKGIDIGSSLVGVTGDFIARTSEQILFENLMNAAFGMQRDPLWSIIPGWNPFKKYVSVPVNYGVSILANTMERGHQIIGAPIDTAINTIKDFALPKSNLADLSVYDPTVTGDYNVFFDKGATNSFYEHLDNLKNDISQLSKQLAITKAHDYIPQYIRPYVEPFLGSIKATQRSKNDIFKDVLATRNMARNYILYSSDLAPSISRKVINAVMEQPIIRIVDGNPLAPNYQPPANPVFPRQFRFNQPQNRPLKYIFGAIGLIALGTAANQYYGFTESFEGKMRQYKQLYKDTEQSLKFILRNATDTSTRLAAEFAKETLDNVTKNAGAQYMNSTNPVERLLAAKANMYVKSLTSNITQSLTNFTASQSINLKTEYLNGTNIPKMLDNTTDNSTVVPEVNISKDQDDGSVKPDQLPINISNSVFNSTDQVQTPLNESQQVYQSLVQNHIDDIIEEPEIQEQLDNQDKIMNSTLSRVDEPVQARVNPTINEDFADEQKANFLQRTLRHVADMFTENKMHNIDGAQQQKMEMLYNKVYPQREHVHGILYPVHRKRLYQMSNMEYRRKKDDDFDYILNAYKRHKY